MNTTAIWIGLVLFAAAVFVVVRPFQQKQTRKTPHNKVTSREEEQTAVLSALRDLDFDYKIGKVSDQDYVLAREHLLAEAARYMEQQDETDTRLEELIQKRRSKSKAENCMQCGAPMEAGQHFCSRCGAQANHIDCPSCGKKVRVGDLFCSSCGHPLQVKMEAVH